MRIPLAFTGAATGTAALSADTDTQRRRITGPAVPFGVASEPAMDGHRYLFAGPPDNPDELIDVVDEHDDAAVVGRLDVPFAVTDAGMDAVARIFATSRGNDVLVETGEGVKTGFSVLAEFDAYEQLPDGVRRVETWTALHLGVVRRPAFTNPAGLTLAASAQQEEGATVDPKTTQPAAPAAAGQPQVVELPTIAELSAQVAKHMAEQSQARVHPLAQYPNRAAFMAAFQAADEEGRQKLAAAFAIADQTTADNPGLVPPGWRTDVKSNLDRRRPAINATGGPIGLPDAGMSASWPYLDPTLDLDTLIAEQAAEKAELSSVKVKILKGDAPIHTAGVATDISYQLLMRSSPAYLAQFTSIAEAAWARYTEAVYEAALLAAATDAGTTPVDLTNAAGAAAFRAMLFDGSQAVEDATGAPASVALVAPGVWSDLGGNDAFKSAEYGTQNVPGTASARTLRININGLDVVRAPFFTGSQVLVTNDLAAKFAETGPMTATQENVTKLGRDVAVWGMYEEAEVYFPAGLVLFDAD